VEITVNSTTKTCLGLKTYLDKTYLGLWIGPSTHKTCTRRALLQLPLEQAYGDEGVGRPGGSLEAHARPLGDVEERVPAIAQIQHPEQGHPVPGRRFAADAPDRPPRVVARPWGSG
jgi:hypothetical protein